MKPGNTRSTLLLVFSLFILIAPSLMAQTSATGALSGTVTDPTGAVVPNATVTATGTNGQLRTATTSADGSYKIPLLPPGAYSVKYEAPGFQTVEIPSVTVTVTETGTLNQSLTMGIQSQQVIVEADVEAVQTANSTVGTVIRSVADLPLANRNFTVLIGLSAGANATVVNAAAGLGKGSQVTSVNGASLTDNNYQMDGVTVVNQGGNGNLTEGKEWAGIPIPNPDAIEEFKIQTSNYDAGYGRNSGGNVNVVTKSGTNAYHGTAWEYFRNTVLNANDFFYKMTELSAGKPNVRQVLNQNQFGGVLGGPIKKDKLFFFASYQETRQKNGLTNQGYSVFRLPYITPPSITSDRTSAAFLNDMLAHYCGSSGTLGGIQIKAPPGGCTSTSPFFSSYNAALATANINQTALNVLQVKLPNGNFYLPSPLVGNSQATCNPTPTTGSTGPTYGCTSSIPTPYAEHQGIGNLDYIINSKHTLSLRYFASEEPIDGAFFGAASYLPVQALPGEPLSDYYKNHAAVLKLTSILTNNLVNEARISYQHNFASQIDGNRTLTSSQVGIVPQQPGYDLFPQITYDTFAIGADTVGDVINRDNQYEFADQVSWTHGKQTVRFGGEYETDRRKWEFPGLSLGSLTYASFPDFLISLPACTPGDATCTPTHPTTTVDLAGNTVQNNGTANPSLSLSSGASAVRYPTPINGLNSGAYQWNYFKAISAFVQDDLKINSRLTVNLGLRWEYFSAPTVDHGKNTDVWPSRVLLNPFPLVATQCTGTLYQTTGCPGSSFAGYVVPSDYDTSVLPPIPAGVFQSNHQTSNRTDQPKDDFAPRLGFAWQPLAGNGRWVMRGGAGFFYSRVPTDTTYSNQSLEQVPQAFQVASVYNIDLPNPYGTTPAGWNPRWVTLNGASSNIRIQTMAENYPTPLVYQWNLNTQYEFAPTWVLEVGYVGSRGIHQWGGYKPNGAVLVSATQPSPTNSATITNTTTNTALRVPYAGFATNWQVNATPQDFKYNSAQATLRKQLSHGFSFQGAYTWSRAFLSSQVGNPNATTPGVPVTLYEYGLNPNYAPHRFTMSYHWDLPFGHPEGLKGKVVGGWGVSGVTVIQTGTPLTITDGRLGTIFGAPVASNAQFATGMGNGNIASSGSLYDRVVTNYFNASAFATVPTGGPFINGVAVSAFGNGKGYGNSGLGVILGPPQKNFDITIQKDTRVGGIRENAVLVFRAEFLNAFNHTQFSNPTSANLSAGTFGRIQSSSVNPRLIQLALKYQF